MRVSANQVSLLLSGLLGLLLLALIWPEADKPPITEEPPKPVADQPPPELSEISVAAVTLPPPPAPAPAPTPSQTPVKPKPVAAQPSPEPEHRIAALKPAPEPVAREAPRAEPEPPKPPIKPLKPAKRPPPPEPAPEVVKKPPPPEPKLEPQPKLVAKPAQKPVPKPAPKPDVIRVEAKSVAQGRTLLRLLEHGSGPGIVIAWPASARARGDLYRHFRACYGMKVALLLGEARLYAAHGNPGQDWRLNTDRYSGFMRRPTGRLSSRERADIERVRGRHGLEEGVPVRIFPRRVDALLLGGLGQAVGVDYAKRESIRARYRMSGGRVWVEDIRADGRPVAGRIDLGPAAGRSCRGART